MPAILKMEPRTQERRSNQRVKVVVLGRYMLADRREFPCQTINMSPGGVALFAPVKGAIGERIVCYLDQLGRVEGKIARQLETGFALQTSMPLLKRDRLAETLTWLANRHDLGMKEDRRHERISPAHARSTLRLPDGREYHVKIVDVSISGCAVTCEAKVDIGTVVNIGQTTGHVVRLFPNGVAIEFNRLIPAQNFDANIEL